MQAINAYYCQKSGGGGLCPPISKREGATAPPAPPFPTPLHDVYWMEETYLLGSIILTDVCMYTKIIGGRFHESNLGMCKVCREMFWGSEAI